MLDSFFVFEEVCDILCFRQHVGLHFFDIHCDTLCKMAYPFLGLWIPSWAASWVPFQFVYKPYTYIPLRIL